jgi:hypothetical protein
MDTLSFFYFLFGSIAVLCFIGYLISKDKRFLEVLPNKNASGSSTVNLIGTAIYGSKLLDAEQLRFYGFEVADGITIPLVKFKTKFISIVFPLIPLRTQVIFDEQSLGLETKFYAMPVKMYWKQAFKILTISYTSLLLIIVIVPLILSNIGFNTAIYDEDFRLTGDGTIPTDDTLIEYMVYELETEGYITLNIDLIVDDGKKVDIYCHEQMVINPYGLSGDLIENVSSYSGSYETRSNAHQTVYVEIWNSNNYEEVTGHIRIE